MVAPAWSLSKGPKLVIGVLHVGSASLDWAFSLREQQLPPGTKWSFLSHLPYDVSRNKCAEEALAAKAEWLLFWDSVPGYTPVLLRETATGHVDVRSICDLAAFSGTSAEKVPLRGWEAWDGRAWAEITAVLRHPAHGPLRRITTRFGRLDTSPNHSVFRAGGWRKAADAGRIRVGDRMAKPRVFRRGPHGSRHIRNNGLFVGGRELAWAYGLFAAEGSVSRRTVSFANKDRDLLEKVQTILTDRMNVYTGVYLHDRIHECYGLDATNKSLARHFSRFYDSLRNKRIPMELLNAPPELQQAFLDGYMRGDGHVDNRGFQSWTTVSPVLASGLLLLMERLGKSTYGLRTRSDKPNVLQVHINKGEEGRGWGPNKDPREVLKVQDVPYNGYLYDLCTTSGRFVGGVGGFLLHNTEIIAPPNGFQLLARHNQPIVSGLYYASIGQNMPEVMRRDPTGSFRAITGWTPGELVSVDTVATGFLLIHRQVVERFKEEGIPLFEWTVGRDASLKAKLRVTDEEVALAEDRLRMLKAQGGGDPIVPVLERTIAELKRPQPEGLSEDFNFGWKAKNLGFPLHVDTQCVCDHVVPGHVIGMGQMRPMTIL